MSTKEKKEDESTRPGRAEGEESSPFLVETLRDS